MELEAWKAFVLFGWNFFGNNKAKNYAELVTNTLTQRHRTQHEDQHALLILTYG